MILSRRFSAAIAKPEPLVLLSEYGELMNLKPLKQMSDPKERKFVETMLVGDNDKSQDIY
jgi:hypothetical protein